MSTPERAMPAITAHGRGRKVALVALCALGQAIFAGIAAFATRDIFLALRDNGETPTTALATIVLSGIGIGLMRVGEQWIAESVGQSYAADLRQKLFNHLSSIPASVVREKRNGGLALRFVGDLSAVRGWVSLGLARLISALIVLPCAAFVLYLLEPRLALAAIVPIIAGLAIMSFIGFRLAPLHRRLRSRRARLAADMSERVPVAAELRLLGRLEIENSNLEKQTNRLVQAAMERALSAASLRAIPDVVSGLAGAALLFAAIMAQTPAPVVAGALAALGLMIQPMRSIAGVWDKHRAWKIAREKCERLLAIPHHACVDESPIADNDGPLELVFKDISAGRLQAFSGKVEAGKSVAVIGQNGAGKSTLLHLAAGIDRPSAGSVTIGGKSPQSLSSDERRHLIGLMGKSSPILAGSLRRALTMGLIKRPKDKAIIEAAQQYGLGYVVERLGGLEGKVAEGGRNLSSGEIRRVFLTRLALGQTQFVLLDEPDDALDASGPDLIMKLLGRPNTGAIVITHSLDLARRCDEIWVIEEGRVTLQGSSETLLAPGSNWAIKMGEQNAA